MSEEHIYEAVDVTDGSTETYYTLGIWKTLQNALDELQSIQDPNTFKCEAHEDYDYECTVEIRERKLGWGSVGTTKATLKWVYKYDEIFDTFSWERDFAVPLYADGKQE